MNDFTNVEIASTESGQASSFVRFATKGEQKAARKLVQRILQDGNSISVCDDAFGGGEFTVKRSTKLNKVLDALCTTGSDLLVIRKQDGESIGSITLIWGNDPSGEELVADYGWANGHGLYLDRVTSDLV